MSAKSKILRFISHSIQHKIQHIFGFVLEYRTQFYIPCNKIYILYSVLSYNKLILSVIISQPHLTPIFYTVALFPYFSSAFPTAMMFNSHTIKYDHFIPNIAKATIPLYILEV